MPRSEHYETVLRARLDDLMDRLETVELQLDEPADPDSEERAQEREDDEVLESLGTSGLAEIRMIQAALHRIEDGSFGICVACGDEISPERLDAVPHAPRCRDCASAPQA